MQRALLLISMLAPALALAQIEELENPGTVTAVQDRQYRMNHELNFGIGVLPLDAYYKGLIATLGYTYHFTDHFAWQVGRGAYSYNVDSGLKDQLQKEFGVTPTAFDQVNWMVGSDLIWSPFYGKIAYLNKSVQHFEVFLIGGISILKLTLAANSTQTSGLAGLAGNFKIAPNIGIGVRLYSNKVVSFRLDFTDNIVLTTPVYNVPTIQLTAALNFGSSE